MDDLPIPAPPPAEPVAPRRGRGDALEAATGPLIGVATASFVAVLLLFVLGQVIQLINMPIGLSVTSLGIFGAAGLFFPALFNLRQGRFTGLARNPGLLPIFCIFIGLVNLPFANFLMAAFTELLPASWSAEAQATTKLLLRADQVSRALIVIGAGVAAPIGEELFFRGWLQSLLQQKLGVVVSVVTVAIAFSAIHFDPVGFVARVELGILFGLARAWTGSLWPAIALHATHNLVSTAVLYFAPDPQAQLDTKLDLKTDGPVALVSLVLMVSVVRAFHRRTRDVTTTVPPDRVPLRITPVPALQIAAVNIAFMSAAVGILGSFRERLPGAELTRGIFHQVKQQLSPQPVQPERTGHLPEPKKESAQ